jgi:hypothetical protein
LTSAKEQTQFVAVRRLVVANPEKGGWGISARLEMPASI